MLFKLMNLRDIMGSRYGAGAGKGFYHAALDRYLLWMMSEGRGYSTAREVTVDEDTPLLLSYPAREYTAMRQAPQANATGLSLRTAAASLSACAGAAQLDIELTFHFPAADVRNGSTNASHADGGSVSGGTGTTVGRPSGGDCVGVSLLGGSMLATITFTSPSVGVLNGGPCGDTAGGFIFRLKQNESSVALHVNHTLNLDLVRAPYVLYGVNK